MIYRLTGYIWCKAVDHYNNPKSPYPKPLCLFVARAMEILGRFPRTTLFPVQK